MIKPNRRNSIIRIIMELKMHMRDRITTDSVKGKLKTRQTVIKTQLSKHNWIKNTQNHS
jgi:hypothetical protein